MSDGWTKVHDMLFSGCVFIDDTKLSGFFGRLNQGGEGGLVGGSLHP